MAVIEITGSCQLKCRHCGTGCDTVPRSGELTAQQWALVFGELASAGVRKVVFSGGEPLLKKDFNQICTAATTSGLSYGVISNGLLLEDKWLAYFAQNKPFAVGVSIDGLPATHDLIRGLPGAFRRSSDAVGRCSESGIQVCVNTTLSKLNFQELPRLAHYLELIGTTSWQIQMASPFGRMKDRASELLSETEFSVVCDTIAGLRNNSTMNIQAADCFAADPLSVVRDLPFTGCQAGRKVVGILADGTLLPCLSLQDARYYCGRLVENSFQELWANSKVLSGIRVDESTTGACAGCPYSASCHGGCKSQSIAWYGRLGESPYCVTRTDLYRDVEAA